MPKQITLIATALSLFCTSLAKADSPQPSTNMWCAIVAWKHHVPARGKPADWLFSKNITVPEDGEVEVFKTTKAIYKASIIQHDTQFDTHTSILILTVVDPKTGRTIASSSAIWPNQPSTGQLAGLNRLMEETDEAETNRSTQFFCDSTLIKEAK